MTSLSLSIQLSECNWTGTESGNGGQFNNLRFIPLLISLLHLAWSYANLSKSSPWPFVCISTFAMRNAFFCRPLFLCSWGLHCIATMQTRVCYWLSLFTECSQSFYHEVVSVRVLALLPGMALCLPVCSLSVPVAVSLHWDLRSIATSVYLFICFICLTTFSRHNLFQYFHFLQRSPPPPFYLSIVQCLYNPSFRTFCCLPVAGMALAFLPGHIAPTLTLTLTELKKKKKKNCARSNSLEKNRDCRLQNAAMVIGRWPREFFTLFFLRGLLFFTISWRYEDNNNNNDWC